VVQQKELEVYGAYCFYSHIEKTTGAQIKREKMIQSRNVVDMRCTGHVALESTVF
jgi:hypothetical protein